MDYATGLFILIYVDDLLIFAETVTIVNRLAALLSKRFPLKELGDMLWFLGCRIIVIVLVRQQEKLLLEMMRLGLLLWI